jgi:hypothetical protein
MKDIWRLIAKLITCREICDVVTRTNFADGAMQKTRVDTAKTSPIAGEIALMDWDRL